MIFTSASQCSRCKLYHEDRKYDAYPDKILDKLWNGDVLHNKAFPGDHRILREPIQVRQFRVQDD